MSNQPLVPPEFDVFLCSADTPDNEMVGRINLYLQRRGFRVFPWDPEDTGTPLERRPELAATIPDFLLALTPATLAALRDPGSRVYAETARAVSTSRNVVLVSAKDDPPLPDDALPPALPALRSRTRLAFDPDRLAESLSIVQHALSSDTTVTDRHLMRRTKRQFIGVAVFLLAAASLQIVPAVYKRLTRPKPLPPVPPFTLYWAGFAQRVEPTGATDVPLADGAALAAGDHLTVAFSPSADGFAYVIAKDVRGRVSVLFPGDALKGASKVRAGRTYRAPVESGWMTIDAQAALDTVYVFASYDPLQNLEELVEEPETPQTIAARRTLVEQTISGLIDGRHYQFGRQPWIRNMQLVDQTLKPAAGPASFSASYPGGTSATLPAVVQPGLVSALAEIKVKVEGAQGK